MKKIARTLRSHRALILNYFRARKQFSSGVVEGLNNKAKLTMRKSYGFRTFHVTETALYHALGRLPVPDVAHKFFRLVFRPVNKGGVVRDGTGNWITPQRAAAPPSLLPSRSHPEHLPNAATPRPPAAGIDCDCTWLPTGSGCETWFRAASMMSGSSPISPSMVAPVRLRWWGGSIRLSRWSSVSPWCDDPSCPASRPSAC